MKRSQKRAGRPSERGAALMLTIAATSIVLMLLLASLTFVQLSGKAVANQLLYHGQALNTASAGLTEALSWFRRQQTQPVVAFNPILDPGDVCPGGVGHTPVHNPTVNDSDAPTVGIVRSFPISTLGKVWGQYEVKRASAADILANKNVVDLSYRRGYATPGVAWQIESEGIVYVDRDGDSNYDVGVDSLLTRKTLLTELFRFTIALPSNAAVNTERGNLVTVQAVGTRIRGGSDGFGVTHTTAVGSSPANPVNPGTGLNAITGTLGNLQCCVALGPFSILSVFGISEQELVSTADDVVTNVSQLPALMPEMGLIVVRGDATFTTTRPLNGSGVLVVLDGTLTVPPGTLWSGFIYVRGSYTQTAPSLISGSVLVTRRADGTQGALTLSSGADFSDIAYDGVFIQQVLQQMGRYRFSRSTYVP